jgi:hypothetical protein
VWPTADNGAGARRPIGRVLLPRVSSARLVSNRLHRFPRRPAGRRSRVGRAGHRSAKHSNAALITRAAYCRRVVRSREPIDLAGAR